MSAQDTTEKHHSSFGDKIRGTAHIVHGIGENIRGSVMGAVESVSGSDEAKAKDEDIVSKGRLEVERGVAQLKGTAAPGEHRVGTQTDSQPQPQQQPAKQEVSGPAQAPAPPGPTVGTETQQTGPGKSEQEQAAQIDHSKTDQDLQATFETQPETGEGPIEKGADAPQGPGGSV